MTPYLDHSVYPDRDQAPTVLETPTEKADYLHRICWAWDFHVHPEPETFELFSGWKEIFDRHPLPTSPAYHAFRVWFGWEAAAPPAGLPAPTPLYEHLDRLEDRPPDPNSF